MFDPAVFTISVQAAGGSGDWRMWHYVVVDDTSLDDVTEHGFFSAMHDHITPGSIVTVVAPGYVAMLALKKLDGAVTGYVMSVAEFPAEGEGPHLQGVPNSGAGVNMPMTEREPNNSDLPPVGL